MAVMDSFLITVDGSEHEVSTGTVRRLLDTSARFAFGCVEVVLQNRAGGYLPAAGCADRSVVRV